VSRQKRNESTSGLPNVVAGKTRKEIVAETRRAIAQETQRAILEETRKAIAKETEKVAAKQARGAAAKQARGASAKDARKALKETSKAIAKETRRAIVETTRNAIVEKTREAIARGSREAITRAIAAEVRAGQNQTDLLDDAAAELLGINRTDHRCIDILERSGPMTAGDLASASGLTTGAITVVLDRLERSGYARRVRDTDDRRRVLVELTAKTQREIERVYGPMTEAYTALMERYTTEQLMLILDYVSAGRELGLQQLKRVRALPAKRGR
jgi:DNA-binding MarR family transcriptional regulator